jgi:hypothetical protein
MSTLLAPRSPSLFDSARGEPTLDDLLVGAWKGLAAHRVVACPVCGDELRPERDAPAQASRGRCSGCGSQLT